VGLSRGSLQFYMLLQEIKILFHKELDVIYPTTEVDSFFYRMIEHYLGLERFILALEPQTVVSKEDEQPLFEGLAKLRLQQPLQYILGTSYFFDSEFIVNKNVLIPRPETEELVQWIIAEIGNWKSEIRILDIGTGSGCIAISLAKNVPNAKVYALDVSEEALNVAKENALKNDVTIEFIQANILELECLNENFDVIVSNPPYVRALEKEMMSSNVKEEEPSLALFVSDEKPLIFYDKITQLAKQSLNFNGVLYFEINQYLGNETKQLLEDENFSEIELRKDMFGNNRMLKGKIKVTALKDLD